MTGVGVSVLWSLGVSVGVSELVPVGVSDGSVVVTDEHPASPAMPTPVTHRTILRRDDFFMSVL